ncbi:MAG: hypothetical protein RLZZ262_1380 [Bacteroidota bacterium]|jgi:hypothetical protein
MQVDHLRRRVMVQSWRRSATTKYEYLKSHSFQPPSLNPEFAVQILLQAKITAKYSTSSIFLVEIGATISSSKNLAGALYFIVLLPFATN